MSEAAAAFPATATRAVPVAAVAVAPLIRMQGVTKTYDAGELAALRRRLGMVFAQAVPLPMSIRQNVTYGLELAGVRSAGQLDAAVEKALRLKQIGNEIERTVSWNSGHDLADLAGKPIRLRIAMKDADLYSLRFR